ncbi:MAG TPA: lipid-A-disaccharide synthase N-terminal domain-containing protein [Xanthobacteraceae bacterium]|nr:lipid-A-disaccharide synthase N-terminal domain-containing protein [Xanthobacteraceae bacterium]
MLAELLLALGSYLYEVFITRLDWWAALGFLAQGLFSARFLVQWIASERAGRSIIPLAFWWFSIGGGFLLLIYSISRKDPVFIAGQGLGLFIYLRNIFFVLRERRDDAIAT